VSRRFRQIPQGTHRFLSDPSQARPRGCARTEPIGDEEDPLNTTDNLQPGDEWVVVADGAAGTDVPPRRAGLLGRFRGLARTVVPVAAALLVGGGVVYALDHRGGSASDAASGGTAVLAGGSRGPGAPGGFGGGGGVDGEQHIQGTVTATTDSTVTVESPSGTATYTVDVTTEIVRNGRSATLADVRVGDPVLVHVYPSSSGQMLVERLFAGTSASDGGPGGFGPPGGGQGFDGNGANAAGPTT
jgi:hypothetical protein